MKRALTILLLATLPSLALVAVATVAVMYTGAFNVATAWQDPAPLRWVLVTTRESSIERRAQAVQAPIANAAARIDDGFRSYREMCVICHGSPGGERSPLARGLNPKPPDLSKIGHRMSAAKLFWVIKNGIRMSGMPAWGPSHSDTELWDIVAFVRALPNMSATEYHALDQRLPPGHGDDGHGDDLAHHGEGAEAPHGH
jgi:mono/diheme cytochrome c family protein